MIGHVAHARQQVATWAREASVYALFVDERTEDKKRKRSFELLSNFDLFPV